MKHTGDMFVEHYGNKYEYHQGDHFIKHIGDTEIQQEGVKIERLNGGLHEVITGPVVIDQKSRSNGENNVNR